MHKIKAFRQLLKPSISISVGISALTAFLIYRGFFAPGWIELTLGVFLLSGGAAAINHVQEARFDKLMKRTSGRPIPAGLITKTEALIFAALMIGIGLWLLYLTGYIAPVILGVLNIIWYNAIYTPLKRVWAYAAVPGAIIGAIPPIMGWTAAGGYIFHPHIMIIAFLFFIGQIPHFWFILLKYANDYEYAGYPTLRRHFTEKQIANISFIWTLTTAMSAILLVIFEVVVNPWLALVVILLALGLVYIMRNWVRSSHQPNPMKAFVGINIFYALIMIVLITDSLIR